MASGTYDTADGATATSSSPMTNITAPADPRVRGIRGVQAQDHAHGSRLAGAVRAEKARHRAGAHREAERVDGERGAIALGQSADFDHVLFGTHIAVLSSAGHSRRPLSCSWPAVTGAMVRPRESGVRLTPRRDRGGHTAPQVTRIAAESDITVAL
jgi:hypothetical protein